jgi:hypothetical protein
MCNLNLTHEERHYINQSSTCVECNHKECFHIDSFCQIDYCGCHTFMAIGEYSNWTPVISEQQVKWANSVLNLVAQDTVSALIQRRLIQYAEWEKNKSVWLAGNADEFMGKTIRISRCDGLKLPNDNK